VEVKTEQNARYSSVAEQTEDSSSALSVKISLAANLRDQPEFIQDG
jgi:hypothetical protein